MSDGHVLQGPGGTIAIPPGTLASIVRQAAETVDGAHVRRRLDLRVDGGRAHVELGLAVRHGSVLPQLARSVQERVAGALTAMTGLEIAAVDVTVERLEA